MPCRARASVGNICYHVINRGNAQSEVFHKDGDYRAFVALIGLACQRIPIRVLATASCQFIFTWLCGLVRIETSARWMQWLLTAHVRRYHQDYRSSGHVWQSRFKVFPLVHVDHTKSVESRFGRAGRKLAVVQSASLANE